MLSRSAMLLYVVLASAVLGAPAPPDAARIVIDAAQVEGQIDRRLYGQFLEFMYEGVKGGLAAELLRSRGFEEAPNAIGLSRDWERYPDDRIDDYGLSFQWDDTVALPVSLDALDEKPALHSLRVDAGGGIVERHGIFQPRLPVRAGIAYQGSLWLKTTGYEGPVVVALEEDVAGGRTYAEAEVRDIQGDWKQYPFVLRPDRADSHARLAILFPGKGRLWVDQVSLLPGDAVGGVRADVEARVAALRPAFLRWPGGNVAQDYHWRWGVGPRDRRPLWTNLAWKNEREPGDIGTDEFVAFCRRVGAEPSITVNVEGRGATVEEAAAWVEYCNGPATSRYGAMRAANGHPEPHRVKYWEIGNEIWGDWVRGHTGADTYARNALRYAQAMRAVDPTIELIATGDNDMGWNRAVLRAAGSVIDHLAIHHYYGRKEMDGDARNLMARPLYYERFYREVEKLIRDEAPGRPIRLSINEWGLDLPETRQHSMEAALYGARLMGNVRAVQPARGHDRGVRPRERMAGRHHPGRPRPPVRHAHLPCQPALQRPPGARPAEGGGLGPHVRHEQGGHRRARPRRRGQPLRGRLGDLRQGREHVTHERGRHRDRPPRRGRASGRGMARAHRAERGDAQQLRHAGRGAASP
jgi:alpha-N-arabinofuranosidase